MKIILFLWISYLKEKDSSDVDQAINRLSNARVRDYVLVKFSEKKNIQNYVALVVEINQKGELLIKKLCKVFELMILCILNL